MPPKAKLHKDKGKLKSIPKIVQSSEPEPSTSNAENQVQFEVELLWCIQQLQTALSSGKLNQKQVQDSTKTLNSLMSNSTPIIRKRQLMRLSFGDYRAKMAEEEAKYIRKNEKISYMPCKPSKKSVFVKKAPFLLSDSNFKFNFEQPKESGENVDNINSGNVQVSNVQTALETLDLNKQEPKDKVNNEFHFAPSNNVFRFNFSVNME